MTALTLFKTSERRLRAYAWACALAIVAALMSSPRAHAAENLTIYLDQARIARLPERVTTVVVGNPLIADVSLQAGGLMVLTGKGYGVTNLVALDRGGTVLAEFSIQVQAPTTNVVVVYRGEARQSYSCTPSCEPRITLGDTPEFFDSVIAQTGTRNLRSQGAGMGGAAGQAGGAPQR